MYSPIAILSPANASFYTFLCSRRNVGHHIPASVEFLEELVDNTHEFHKLFFRLLDLCIESHGDIRILQHGSTYKVRLRVVCGRKFNLAKRVSHVPMQDYLQKGDLSIDVPGTVVFRVLKNYENILRTIKDSLVALSWSDVMIRTVLFVTLSRREHQPLSYRPH